MLDYVQCCDDKEKLKNLAETVKEKLPTLLASRHGLNASCALFNVLDAKDRKLAIKALPINEMLANKNAHLFLIHVANTLDDTQLTKKKLLHEALKLVDDMIGDKCYQNFLIACLIPPAKEDDKNRPRNTLLTKEDYQGFQTCQEFSSSKKDAETRSLELFKIA